MKLLGLTLLLCFMAEYPGGLSTIFLDPQLFLSDFLISKTSSIQDNSIPKVQSKPKKLEIKTIKSENFKGEPISENIELETGSDESIEINVIEKNESVDDTDSLINSDEYEDIIFSDVFDSGYWEGN